jgi:alginate O-acetyltransferase complex protein AlgI
VEKELSYRPNTINNVANGFRRFVVGLGKKVILANNMAIIIDHYLTFEIISLSTPLAWIGILAYTLQIYFDFSGYSDMAIGMGKMFGFNFLENFNYPYMSKSITEFWRRWHISLGTWFRDYVYIPLGGNRVSKARWLLNIFIVWFLTGFWHGAKWNFVIWGLWYGFFLVLEKLLFAKFLDRLPRLFAWGYTFLVTVFGWVFFRLESWNDIKDYFMVLMGMGHYSSSHVSIEQLGQLYPYYFFVPAILGITPVFHWLYNKALNKLPTTIMLDIYLAIVFIISICFLLIDTYNPFIYFRF